MTRYLPADVIIGLAALFACAIGSPGASAQATQSAGRPDSTLIDDLVIASRILADQSVLDGFWPRQRTPSQGRFPISDVALARAGARDHG